ncbi:tyrosine-type recombinase/integrase [Nitrosopumilus adriaticus]|uniref:Integrase family protein n=1 Tax=Nitrosopumilus adriaticus TaxID=1580092 RepID=A0A0D5C2M0_9ARCH|nr:tyrosine-type recombinase/integrase [Nitrosopumilus adriaticus]AJW71049.1 Integrase family protein [Nitrosopumilus adriaticus]
MQKYELAQDQVSHYYNTQIKRIQNKIKKELSQNNQKLISKYHQEMIIQSLAKATQVKQLQTILTLSKMLKKDWKDATKSDIRKIALQISKKFCDKLGKETFYSYDHKKMLRIFFRWFKLGSRSYIEVGDPPETKQIRTHLVFNKLARKDLISQKDRLKLLDACNGNLRDRAFIDCHLEAGTRPAEILNLQIHHVHFDNLGALIQVSGKTGTRIVRLIKSGPSLSSWLNVHPLRDNYDAPLWIKTSKRNFGDSMTHAAANAMIKRRARIAKLKKPINLNLFRHSAATDAANYLTDAQMRDRHGWSSYSKVPGRYVHLTHKDVDNAMTKYYGLSRAESRGSPIKCSICEMQNNPEQNNCWKCGKALSLKSVINNSQIFGNISKNLSISYYLI